MWVVEIFLLKKTGRGNFLLKKRVADQFGLRNAELDLRIASSAYIKKHAKTMMNQPFTLKVGQ